MSTRFRTVERSRAFVLAWCCLLAALAGPLGSVGDSIEIFNPDWSIILDDFGYSDLAFDQRFGYEYREYLSGEWAAAIGYVRNGFPTGPIWLNHFAYPDWDSNSDYSIVSALETLPQTNQWGFSIIRSTIQNASLQVQITSQMIDTTNGIPQGVAAAGAATGSYVMSDRYVLRQTLLVHNMSANVLTDVKLYKFLHSLQATRAVYDDRDYGSDFGGFHYTLSQEGVDDFYSQAAPHDTVALHAKVAPSAWEVGRYGIEGVDSHVTGKPSVGVHLSVEAGSLSGRDEFGPTNRWIGGALVHNIGTLAQGASVEAEFLMTVRSIFESPFPAFPIVTKGVVAGWGDNSSGQTNVPAGLTNVTAIAAGGGHGLALTPDGKVVAWGDNSYGQTNVPAGLSSEGVYAIAAGSNHNLALTWDYTLAAWGDNSHGQSSVPAEWASEYMDAIAAGGNHSLALTWWDDTVVGWGDNTHGQSSVPSWVSSEYVDAIAAGGNHSLALTWEGTVLAWGDNTHGQSSVPAGLASEYVYAIAAGGNHSLALIGDGTVVAWGDDTHGQSSVPAGLTNVAAIAAGGNHSLALTRDGTVVAWGDNTHGQSSVPAGLGRVSGIAAGGRHSLALRAVSTPTCPDLAIARSGDQVIITWPAARSMGVGYLEEAPRLAESAWAPVSASATLSDRKYRVVLPVTGSNCFFRICGEIVDF